METRGIFTVTILHAVFGTVIPQPRLAVRGTVISYLCRPLDSSGWNHSLIFVINTLMHVIILRVLNKEIDHFLGAPGVQIVLRCGAAVTYTRVRNTRAAYATTRHPAVFVVRSPRRNYDTYFKYPLTCRFPIIFYAVVLDGAKLANFGL